MDLYALSKLVIFGGDISRRLIAFSQKIDEAPSSLRSIGYEIRSTCDVLNELHGVIQKQQNERMSSISSAAIEEIQETFDKCDEIIYEVAQGVLVAHERLKVVPLIDGAIVLSIQERTKWPLLRPRLYSLISDLSDAKMDIVLHLLVLQVRSERYYGHRIEVAVFAKLTAQQREDTIAHLWHYKMDRDAEQPGSGPRSPTGPGRVGPGEGGSPTLRRLSEEVAESDSSDIETSSDCSEKRGRGIFRRIVRRLSGSLRSPSNSGSPPNEAKRPAAANRILSDHSTLTRSSSNSAKSTSEQSNNSSGARSWSSSSSMSNTTRPARLKAPTRPSLLSITNPIVRSEDGTVQTVKKVSFQHGPTMSAKRGIDLEWETTKSQGRWEEGSASEERKLGRQLLFNQLSAKAARPHRDTLSTVAIVDMLVTRWTTSPRHKRDSFLGALGQVTSGSSEVTFYSGGGGDAGMAENRSMPAMRRQLTV